MAGMALTPCSSLPFHFLPLGLSLFIHCLKAYIPKVHYTSWCKPLFLFVGIISLASWPVLPYPILPFFLNFQEDINKKREMTIVAVFWDLPTKGEEKTGREVIPSEEEGDSPVCQSFEKALLGWSQVLKTDELLTLTEEWWYHLTVTVIYFSISICSQFPLTFFSSLYSLPSHC